MEGWQWELTASTVNPPQHTMTIYAIIMLTCLSGFCCSVNEYMHMINGNQDALNVCHWNCARGFVSCGKKDEIEHFMNEKNVHIMAICEIELVNRDLFTLNEYTMKGYNILLPRSWSSHGKARIMVYIKSDIASQVTTNSTLMTTTQPDLHLHVKTKKGDYINIVFYYREFHGLVEGDEMTHQLNRLQEHIELVSEAASNEEIWWMGDINIDYRQFIKHENWSKLSELLETIILEQGLFQMVGENTRGRITSTGVEESLLDHIYTNNPEMTKKIWNIQITSSDHNIIGFTRDGAQLTQRIKGRNLKNLCKEKLKKELSSHNWKKIANKQDLEVATMSFTTTLLTTFNKLAPLREIRHNNKNKLMLSSEVREIIKNRDKAYKEAKTSGNGDDRKIYKNLRKQVVREIKTAKDLRIKNEMTNQKSAWAYYKSITNKIQAGGPPEKLQLENEVTSDALEMAETINLYFINKIKKLRREIESQEIPYDAIEHMKKKIKKPIRSFSLMQVSEEQVEKIIEKLKTSNGCGVDGISNNMTKLAKKEILSPLTKIINRSLTEGKVPRCFKMARIVPLHKKMDPLDVANYRPVAILPKLSLILESVVHKQIIKHFTDNEIYSKNQHGFTKGRSCMTCLTTIFDRWARASNEKKYTGVLCLDMCAGFDLVDKTILLKKMEALGIEDNALRWIENYLTDRFQSVGIKDKLSSKIEVLFGVPQGSLLGPLLFLIYCLDLPLCTRHGTLDQYADDSASSYADKDAVKICQRTCEDAEEIEQWMRSNYLKLSPGKTDFMILAGRGVQRSEEMKKLTIQVAGQVFQQSEYIKLLGILFHEGIELAPTLRRTEDHKGLLEEISMRINMIKRIKPCNEKTLLNLTNGIVLSKILYGIQLTGGSTAQMAQKFQTLLNRAARVVTGAHRSTPGVELMRQCSWLSYKNLVTYHSLLLLYKIKLCPDGSYLSNKINSRRSRVMDKIATYETNYVGVLNNSFLPRTIRDFNNLSEEIRGSGSIKKFKKLLWTQLQKLTEENRTLGDGYN